MLGLGPLLNPAGFLVLMSRDATSGRSHELQGWPTDVVNPSAGSEGASEMKLRLRACVSFGSGSAAGPLVVGVSARARVHVRGARSRMRGVPLAAMAKMMAPTMRSG